MKATKNNILLVMNELNNNKTRSAWSRGVKDYALDILNDFDEWRMYNESEGLECPELNEETALNGAKDWKEWAYGGCGAIYDTSIAESLCTPSELKKYKGGAIVPAGVDTWLDIEARAAYQAWRMIADAVRVVEA